MIVICAIRMDKQYVEESIRKHGGDSNKIIAAVIGDVMGSDLGGRGKVVDVNIPDLATMENKGQPLSPEAKQAAVEAPCDGCEDLDGCEGCENDS